MTVSILIHLTSIEILLADDVIKARSGLSTVDVERLSRIEYLR